MPSRGIFRPGVPPGASHSGGSLRSVGKRKTFRDIPLHQFSEGGGGMYGDTQTSDSIKMGDLLEVPSENMAGFLYSAWPVAVTKETAGMHEIAEGGPQKESWDSQEEHERYVRGFDAAKALKAKRGYA